jgi:cytosine/adenosine deaminase-related metal-dependent hydrolase
MPFVLGALALMALGILSTSTLPGPEPSALVLRGRMIDGTGAAPIERGVVVMHGDRITCVGHDGDCDVLEDAQIIDVGDGTILPGLIDLHVHARPHYLTWFLAAGVTTIRDANNSPATIEALLAIGPHRPRMVWTGPMLDGTATVMRHFGEEGVLSPDAHDLSDAFTLEVASPDAARAAVDSLAARGMPFVKLYEQLPLDVFEAATEQARHRGILVMTDLGVHTTRGLVGAEVDALQALAAGVRSIEHASGYALAYQRLGGDPSELPYDADLIDRLARATVEAGTAVVPTLSVFYAYADDVTEIAHLPLGDRFENFPAPMQEHFHRQLSWRTDASRRNSYRGFELAAQVTRRVHELGGRIGAGSDTPAGVFNVPGGALHRELELLVRAGLSPLQALHAATGGAADILDRPELGRLQPGAAADVLVVHGNPAQDIRDTRRIHTVVLAGQVLDRDILFPGPVGLDAAP